MFSERGGQSTLVGGSGGMCPHKILNFRPSEVVSGAFWVENCFLRLLYVNAQALAQPRLKECVSLYCTSIYAYACARTRINSVGS